MTSYFFPLNLKAGLTDPPTWGPEDKAGPDTWRLPCLVTISMETQKGGWTGIPRRTQEAPEGMVPQGAASCPLSNVSTRVQSLSHHIPTPLPLLGHQQGRKKKWGMSREAAVPPQQNSLNRKEGVLPLPCMTGSDSDNPGVTSCGAPPAFSTEAG